MIDLIESLTLKQWIGFSVFIVCSGLTLASCNYLDKKAEAEILKAKQGIAAQKVTK